MHRKMIQTLHQLPLNQIGMIQSISDTLPCKQRLLDFGFVTGSQIKPLFRSCFQNPTAYEIRGSILAIRKEDAEKIIILPIS